MIAKIVVLLATLAVALATPACKCGRSSKPVCGTDAHTYENECLLMCAGLTNSYIKLDYQGPCKPQHPLPPSPCGICTLIYMPLCGSDGRTYSNECEFNCAKSLKANLEKISDGACKETVKVVEGEKVQVVEGEKVQVVEGEKVQVVEGEKVQVANGNLFQNCMCVRNYKPVCGTDGQTYSNECVLGCNQGNNKDLQVARQGPCETVKVVEHSETDGSINLGNRGCICGKNLKPVCGSDGNTYANSCKLNCARVDNPSLRVANVGPCDDIVRVVN